MIACYTAGLEIEPNNLDLMRGRGDAWLGFGKHAEALADYERALKADPTDSSLLNNLAWLLATSPVEKLRDGKRAVTLATEACRRTEYKQAHILSTLAAAYAETGDFKTAIHWSEKAVAAGAADEKDALNKELASYHAGKPVRELQTGKEEKRVDGKR